MRRPIWQLAGLVLAAALPAANACAQIEGLPGKGGKAGDLKGMAGLASSPLASGSMSNVAGLLQYCIGNGQLSEKAAGPVKDQLMAKLPGGANTEDRGYSDGMKGLLHGSQGNLVDLGGGGGAIGSSGSAGTGGLTADLATKACDTILAQAKSFL